MTDYSDHPITQMAMSHLSAITPPGDIGYISDRLFTALECPADIADPFSNEIVWVERNPDNSEVVAQSLLAVFSRVAGAIVETRHTSDLGQLLCGMERSQCWRVLTGTEEGAYLLATGLIGYVECYLESYKMDVATAPSICRILNTWLRPAVAWEQLPSIGVVCEHMFGSAWPALVLPDDQWGPAESAHADARLAVVLVLKDRPRFLPGLCPSQTAQTDVELPGDVGVAGTSL
jgi:hypothetical protein